MKKKQNINFKIASGARRKKAVEAGEYDGRFRPKRFRDKTKYHRPSQKNNW